MPYFPLPPFVINEQYGEGDMRQAVVFVKFVFVFALTLSPLEFCWAWSTIASLVDTLTLSIYPHSLFLVVSSEYTALSPFVWRWQLIKRVSQVVHTFVGCGFHRRKLAGLMSETEVLLCYTKMVHALFPPPPFCNKLTIRRRWYETSCCLC